MGRRVQKSELEFGSDSFLDVVCNIVGILIILIVVVAVKVERQPRTPADLPAEPSNSSSNAVIELVTQRERTLAELESEQRDLAVQVEEFQQAESLAASQAESLAREHSIAQQENELKTLQAGELAEKFASLSSEKHALQARLASLRQSATSRDAELNSLDAAILQARSTERDLGHEVHTTVLETQRLQEVLESTQQAAAPRDVLEHRLSPVTKPVESEELHFRAENGRVSRIPLDELLERLKSQVMTRRSAVMKFDRVEGLVGPVQGYSMSYVVEREGPSALEALQSGDGRMRISVSKWTITPDASLLDESIEEAVQPGSRFRSDLETAPPDSVVTVWVYPESFEAFSRLRELAHGLQLRVAARPLPAGTPIVGSPNGSKSTAQ